jgi:hypothetical protein
MRCEDVTYGLWFYWEANENDRDISITAHLQSCKSCFPISEEIRQAVELTNRRFHVPDLSSFEETVFRKIEMARKCSEHEPSLEIVPPLAGSKTLFSWGRSLAAAVVVGLALGVYLGNFYSLHQGVVSSTAQNVEKQDSYYIDDFNNEAIEIAFLVEESK